MNQLFISYRREDSAAGRLADQLRRELGEDKVFFDVSNIRAGDDFAAVIQSRIQNSTILLAVIGKNWCGEINGRRRLDDEEDFVRLEIAAALKRRIRVIPVLVAGASMPAVEELPNDIKELRRYNWIEIRDVSFDRDVAALIRDITGESFLKKLFSRVPKSLVWPAAGAALAAAVVFVWFNPLERTAPFIDPSSFRLKLQVRLSDAFGPVDKPPELKLAHRLPREMGTQLLELGKPIMDREFEYESPVFMPSKGERYLGLLHRIVRESTLVGPRRVEVCFERKVETLNREPIVRLKCEEGGSCQVAPDDFGWAQTCAPEAHSFFFSVAYAQTLKSSSESGWAVPSLQTLRGLHGGKETRGFTEFKLTSGPLPSLKEADRLIHAIRVNGVPIYIDGLPPEVNAAPFNSEAGVKLEFGVENLDFAGKNAGQEHIDVSLRFMKGARLIRQADVRLQYVALRPKPETSLTIDQDVTLRWEAIYHRGKRQDVYQIFLLSTPSVKEAQERKRRIDEAKLSVGDIPLVAVLRPPLGENTNFGVALGIQQPSGQVKFTFDDETSQKVCRGVIKLNSGSSLMGNSPYRRNIDNIKDSKQCRYF
jgi:TIR domain